MVRLDTHTHTHQIKALLSGPHTVSHAADRYIQLHSLAFIVVPTPCLLTDFD